MASQVSSKLWTRKVLEAHLSPGPIATGLEQERTCPKSLRGQVSLQTQALLPFHPGA